MAVIDAVDRFRTTTDATREAIRARVVGAFTRIGAVDDEALELFVAQVLPLVQGGQLRVSALTEAYLAQIAAEVLGGLPEPVGIRQAEYAELRNGIPGELVYARPFITARKALADGADLARAIQVGASRLDSTVQVDLQLAERRAAHEVVRADDRITGFRRVLRPAASAGGSCGLCLAASSQRYGKDQLLPIHNRCHCGVMPIFGRRDEAVTINRERYAEASRIARTADDGTVQRGGASRRQLANVRVREHGELGPVLTKRGDKFTGPTSVGAA